MRELLDALERPVDLLVALRPGGDAAAGLPRHRLRSGDGAGRRGPRRALAARDVSASRTSRPASSATRRSPCSRTARTSACATTGCPGATSWRRSSAPCIEAGQDGVVAAARSRSNGSRALDRDLTIDVFVTPTCPHCPPAVLLAYRAALASPRIRASAIEATEFPALADSMDVWSVPRIVVNGVPHWDGTVPERVFVDRILAPAFE